MFFRHRQNHCQTPPTRNDLQSRQALERLVASHCKHRVRRLSDENLTGISLIPVSPLLLFRCSCQKVSIKEESHMVLPPKSVSGTSKCAQKTSLDWNHSIVCVACIVPLTCRQEPKDKCSLLVQEFGILICSLLFHSSQLAAVSCCSDPPKHQMMINRSCNPTTTHLRVKIN